MSPVAPPNAPLSRPRARSPVGSPSMRMPSFVLVLLLVGGAAAQANFNVTLLARVDDHAAYNDVWGYTAPDGREYALLGGRQGLAILNVTDPLAPVEVAWFPGVDCIWRDIKTWQHWVYVVNDCAGGVQVIDMADPDAPVVVNEFGLSFLQHAHNVQIDTQTGKLYACGSGSGMVIYDLAANPVNPPKVTQWKGQGLPGSNGYVHDVYVLDGVAHAGLIYDGLYALLDVDSLPSISVIGSKASGEDFTHSTWTDAASQVAVIADETGGARNLTLFDISAPGSPVMLANLSQGPGTLPHNPYILGQRVHVSYYELGYVAYDISDPATPVEIGRFDTTPSGGAALLDGAWGCYPFAPSGLVYISDINNGLYILKLNTPCPPDGSGAPRLCETWPATLPAAGQVAPQVLLSGGGLAGATAVHVGSVTLGAGQFTVLDDQVIAFPMPAVAATGLVDIRVDGPGGSSAALHVPVQHPGDPLLASGPQQVPVGGSIAHTLTSAPGDLQLLAFSTAPLPSQAAKVAFAIGDGFTSLFLLAPLAAGPGGVTALPPFPVPAAAAGLTVYWQFAALGNPPSFPAPVSNVSISVLLP